MPSFNCLDDPIVAIATASGRGGIGVIRISFGRAYATALEIAERLTGKKLIPRIATYTNFFCDEKKIIDQGIAIYFPEPNSYTGEAVLELQAHGGRVIMQMLLREVIKVGKCIDLRHAEPGEFTKRAYLNDKLDLVQAEAIADLITANTEAAVKSASRSLMGNFSKKIKQIQSAITDLRVIVEACLDFPEEDVDVFDEKNIYLNLTNIKSSLFETIRQAKTGILLNDGITVVLTGPPNVGKSSLLNKLVDNDVAIVSDEAGTTRDKIQYTIQIKGIPINIVDTAGLRNTQNLVEKMGIERTLQALEHADCVLCLIECYDRSHHDFDLDTVIRSRVNKTTKLIRVINKIDLLNKQSSYVKLSAGQNEYCAEVQLSVNKNYGLDLLKQAILDAIGVSSDLEDSSVFSARERHVTMMLKADFYLDQAVILIKNYGENIELFAENLRLAQQALGEIVGELSSDELLGEIFSRFCVGK